MNGGAGNDGAGNGGVENDGVASGRSARARAAGAITPRHRGTAWSRRRPGGRGGGLALALLAAFTLSGCVSLPTTGKPETDISQNSGQGSAVQIWAQPPQANEQPKQIVDDFLQAAAAATSEPADSRQTEIAKMYLTAKAVQLWDPREVSVFDSNSISVVAPDVTGGGDGTYGFSGNLIGQLSDTGSYTVTANTSKQYKFHVVMLSKGVYRIDWMQQGFGSALTQGDFAASYSNYNLYYVNRANPGSANWIPVPVYLRSSVSDHDQASFLAKELFDEPDWLGSIAENAVPDPTLKSLSIEANGTAAVTVANVDICTSQPQDCGLLADQLLATFTGLTSISAVQVLSTSGNPLGAPANAPSAAGPPDPDSAIAYYLGSDATHQHQVYSLNGRDTPGRFVGAGLATSQFGQLAVGQTTNGGSVMALTNLGNTKLFTAPVAPVGSSVTTSEPLYTRYSGTAISGLSWDDFSGLWFTDTPNGGTTEVYRIDETQPQAVAQLVDITGIEVGGTVKSVAIAPDGQRLAVVVDNQAGGYDDLIIGNVQHLNGSWSVDLGGGDSQTAAAQWSNITQVAWRDSAVLGVLGSPQASAAGTVANNINELRTDGSPVIDSVTQELVSITPLKYLVSFAWAADGSLLADTQPPTTPLSATGVDSENLLSMTSGGTLWSPRAEGSLGTLPATTP